MTIITTSPRMTEIEPFNFNVEYGQMASIHELHNRVRDEIIMFSKGQSNFEVNEKLDLFLQRMCFVQLEGLTISVRSFKRLFNKGNCLAISRLPLIKDPDAIGPGTLLHVPITKLRLSLKKFNTIHLLPCPEMKDKCLLPKELSVLLTIYPQLAKIKNTRNETIFHKFIDRAITYTTYEDPVKGRYSLEDILFYEYLEAFKMSPYLCLYHIDKDPLFKTLMVKVKRNFKIYSAVTNILFRETGVIGQLGSSQQD